MGSLTTHPHRSGRPRPRRVAVLLATIVVGLTLAIAASASASSNGATGWGVNTSGQLGNGTAITLDVPTAISGLNEVAAVSGSVALLADSKVLAWGPNDLGQLGDGTTTGPETCANGGGPCSKTPVAVSGLSGVVAIAASPQHRLALLSDGTVMAWGANGNGQLGDGSTENRDTPVAVSGLSDVTAIAASGRHSLALLGNGTVMAWGDNVEGDLGDGTTVQSDVPVAVAGLTAVTAIAAGDEHNLALLGSGTLMAWGRNQEGELGNGTHNTSYVPVPVSELTGVTAIAAGVFHDLALLSTGTVMSWGANGLGQLGNGSTTFSTVPVAVSGISGVTAVSAGGSNSMALLAGGSVMAWGGNPSGELGDGTTTGPEHCATYACSTTPVHVCGLSEATGISATGGSNFAYGPPSLEPAPSITAISPSTGLRAGGTSVNITGTGFTDECMAVNFGRGYGGTATFTVNSSTSITATSPGGTGVADVTAVNAAGISPATAADQFTFVPPPPTITKRSPTGGLATGGTTVTLTGANFLEVTAVKFGTTAAASFHVNSPTSITAVSPAEPAGAVDMTVTTTGGTSSLSKADRFTFKPTVTGVSPNNGSSAGGTAVTIAGTGFALGTSATKVKFGATYSKSVNCTSSTTCNVVTPAHAAGIIDVVVVVNKVVSTKGPGDRFTYN